MSTMRRIITVIQEFWERIFGKSKYIPHQGKREKERRVRQRRKLAEKEELAQKEWEDINMGIGK